MNIWTFIEVYADYIYQSVWTVLVVAITIWVTTLRKNYLWRTTIQNHLGEITKSEIDQRDETIAKQSNEIKALQQSVNSLREKVQLMARLSDKAVETAGATHRRQA